MEDEKTASEDTGLAIDERLDAFEITAEDQRLFQSIGEDIIDRLDWVVEPAAPRLQKLIDNGEMAKPCEIEGAKKLFKNWLRMRFTQDIGEPWLRRAASLGNWIFEHQVPGFYIAAIVSNCYQRMGQLACESAQNEDDMVARLGVLGKFDRMEIELAIGRLNRIQYKVENQRRNEYAERFRTSIADLVETTTKRIDDVIQIAAQTKFSTSSLVGNATEIASATDQSAQVMSQAAEESSRLVTSIEDTRNSVRAISDVSTNAARKADTASEIIANLEKNSHNIESVVTVIRDVADLTNILALNATIEAARAGDAGRSFAIVAEEVKSLAEQTATATNDISLQVSEIQNSGNRTVEANNAIASSIGDVSRTTADFETAMHSHSEQVVAIVSMIDETAMTAQSMAETVNSIQHFAEGVDRQAEELTANFSEIDGQFRSLQSAVNDFLRHLSD